MNMAAMGTMEHPETTVSAPDLVEARLVLNFCSAVVAYGEGIGAHDEVSRQLRALRARLDYLRDLASLCRLAIVGEPQALARVIDEMYCISVDYPANPIEQIPDDIEVNEDEPDDSVVLGAFIDLLAGASFVSKNQPEQRNRFIVGIVRAVENAIAFPITFSAEAATYIGDGDSTMLPLHAKLVIANATQRLIDGDGACVPRIPNSIRQRLYCLAQKWMTGNPVDSFFAAISGPKVRYIVQWEDPNKNRPDDARVGDAVTILVETSAVEGSCSCENKLENCVVMFCPHTPAPVVRVVRDGLQVYVPEGSRTGPIAVLNKSPELMPVQALVARYAKCFPVEWSTSIFAKVRMDVWAFPTAFAPPIIEIMRADMKGARMPGTDSTSGQKSHEDTTVTAAKGVPQ